MNDDSLHSNPSNSPGSVYIIDDDFDIVAMIGSILAGAGYRVETATDPVAAFKKELPFRPDILLIDIMMPRMSGIEVMERIGRSSERDQFRIITVSALADQENIERAAAAGADDYLAKPFHPEELLLRVSRQMEELRKSRAAAEGEGVAVGRGSIRGVGVREGPKQKDADPVPGLKKVDTPRLPAPGRAPRPVPSGAKVLVIDDDPDIRALVKSSLEVRGHHVVLSEDGDEGLKLSSREEPDLIILDIMMPRMSGYEVARQLAARPHTAAIPILMLSSKGSLDDVTEGLRGFADEYVTKPFRPDELAARVEALVRRTLSHTREKREQRWVIQQFADRGLRRGFQFFSRYLENVPDTPPQWKGPVPDLIIQRRRRSTVFLVESVESLHDERTIGRWQELEGLEGVSITIVGMSQETSRLATKIKRERGFRARIQWTRPKSSRAPGWWYAWLTGDWKSYAIAIVIAILASFLFANIMTGYFRDKYFDLEEYINQEYGYRQSIDNFKNLFHKLNK
ncbi:response regulator [Nitrospinota bacterium]